MTLANVLTALQTHMAAAAGAAAVGMRRPGTQTPAVVWEMTSAECVWLQRGVPGAGWQVTCEVSIYADTVAECVTEADQIVTYWNNPLSPTATLVCTGVSATMRTESQADGSEGDERICVLTLTLQGA